MRDRLAPLKAARDALLIEAAVAILFAVTAFGVLVHQGVIVIP
jgi:hypothetical protein